jgi:inhibitor of KinA sporulation pathway (predicted exonuclease)
MQLCLRLLTKPDGLKELTKVQQILVNEGKIIFAKFLQINSKLTKFNKNEKEIIVTQPDEKIVFRQLKANCKAGDFDVSEEQAPVSETDFLQDIKS